MPYSRRTPAFRCAFPSDLYVCFPISTGSLSWGSGRNRFFACFILWSTLFRWSFAFLCAPALRLTFALCSKFSEGGLFRGARLLADVRAWSRGRFMVVSFGDRLLLGAFLSSGVRTCYLSHFVERSSSGDILPYDRSFGWGSFHGARLFSAVCAYFCVWFVAGFRPVIGHLSVRAYSPACFFLMISSR